MVSVAIWLASWPAAAPPMPSATMNSDPRSPPSCSRTGGCSDATPRVRSATRKRSSLWSRVLPRSVLATTWILTGLGERPNMLGLVLSVDCRPQSLIALAARIESDGLLDPVMGMGQVLQVEQVHLCQRVGRVGAHRWRRGGVENARRGVHEERAGQGVDRVLQARQRRSGLSRVQACGVTRLAAGGARLS